MHCPAFALQVKKGIIIVPVGVLDDGTLGNDVVADVSQASRRLNSGCPEKKSHIVNEYSKVSI